MDRVRFLDHKGRKILLVDCSGADIETIRETTRRAKPIIACEPKNSLLILTDITDVPNTREASSISADFANHNKPFIKASAIVGVDGLKKAAFQAVVFLTGRKIKSFASRDEALEWLASQ